MSDTDRALAIFSLDPHEKTGIDEGINKRPGSGQLCRIRFGFSIRVHEEIIVERCSTHGHVRTRRK